MNLQIQLLDSGIGLPDFGLGFLGQGCHFPDRGFVFLDQFQRTHMTEPDEVIKYIGRDGQCVHEFLMLPCHIEAVEAVEVGKLVLVVQ